MARAKTKSASQRTSKSRSAPAKKSEPQHAIGTVVMADSDGTAPKDGTWHPCDGSQIDAGEHSDLAAVVHGDSHVDATVNLPLLANCFIRIK